MALSRMTATITMDEAGQITLPAALKRAFGAVPGARLRAEVTAGRIEIVSEVSKRAHAGATSPVEARLEPVDAHQAWLGRLEKLRQSVGTGKEGTTTEEILDDLRSERG